MGMNVLKKELDHRLEQFHIRMNQENPDWETALVIDKVNQYYFTGTMQDGLLVMKKNGEKYYFVRRSIERAMEESEFAPVYPMDSYRDAAQKIGKDCGNTYIEKDIVTVAILERLEKHFSFSKIGSLDPVIFRTRAEKSRFELGCMEHSGKLHDALLRSTVPGLLKEGMNEADFAADIFREMIRHGHHGVARFSMFQTPIVVGEIGFGESSLRPTCVDGPGGAQGICRAVPAIGSRERLLKRGDLVFVDIGFGMDGYHTDKTQIYMFGGKPSEETVKAHRKCIEIEKRMAELLKPGALPSEIYENIMNQLSDAFKVHFMGFGQRTAKFLGHGIGLHIDEPPVIARGFSEPLLRNMAIALEPKKGIPDIGMVGVEDTYIVESGGGRCITGGGSDIILV